MRVPPNGCVSDTRAMYYKTDAYDYGNGMAKNRTVGRNPNRPMLRYRSLLTNRNPHQNRRKDDDIMKRR